MLSENRVTDEIISKKKNGRARQDVDDNTIQRMRFACCVNKARDIDTHSEYKILIAFTRQKWLLEPVSVTLIRTLLSGSYAYRTARSNSYSLLTVYKCQFQLT